MDKSQVISLIGSKKAELIDKYFPETTDVEDNERTCYPADLPFKAQKEFYDYLESLWQELYPGHHESFLDIMDRYMEIPNLDANYIPSILKAKKDAEMITLWERVFHTNHKDVKEYRNLLKEYTTKLLAIMARDFSEDIH